MAGMVTVMLIKEDPHRRRCSKEIKEIIKIRDQGHDEKQNLVLTTVVGRSPEKIPDKIICKGGGTVQSVEIVPAKPKEAQKKPEKPKESQKKLRKKPEEPKESRKKPEEPKESRKKPEEPKESRKKKPEKLKESRKKKPEKSKESQKKPQKPKELENKPEKPKVRENPPVRPLSREDSSDGNDEKEVRENPSANSSEPVHDVSPHGSSRRRITSWQKGELLGRGSYGSVYKGFDDHDRFFFAVKEVSLLDQGSRGEERLSRLQQEISLLSQFDHENIVRYLGSDKDDTNLYVFLELMTEGSLKTLYGKFKLTDSQVSAYTRQILNGLKYLHDREVVHRDIKCANILVGANGSVKLADFGLAKAIEMNSAKTSIGTFNWMAPEVVNSERRSSQLNGSYGLEADIWSLGCTVLEMLTSRYPYHPLEPQALFKSAQGEPPQVPDSLSSDAQDFIRICLQVNPNDRPTAAQLLDHPFVRGINPPTTTGFVSPLFNHNSRNVLLGLPFFVCYFVVALLAGVFFFRANGKIPSSTYHNSSVYSKNF